MQPVAVGVAHIIHAYGCHRFNARVYFSGTDGKTAAAAYAQRTDSFAVNKPACAKVINRSTEIFGINIRRYGIARLAFAAALEGKVNRKSGKALFCKFGSI